MPVNYQVVSAAFSIIEGLAIILTLFRLGFRLKIHRFWWEDMWAAVALLCTVVSIVFCLLATFGTGNHVSTLIAERINAYMFTCIVWSVRMSLIFSVIRITYTSLLRRTTLAAAACFVLFWASTLSLQAWWCMGHTSTLPGDTRSGWILPRSIIIYQVTINCIADTMSVVFPLRLLWRVKLPRRQRRMVLSLFTTSRFLCIFSLAHSISQLVGNRNVEVILAKLQLTAFLIICNLLVVVTYIYRVFLSSTSEHLPSASDPSDDDDFTTPAPRSTSTGDFSQDLTTVDLELARTSISETTSEFKSDFLPSSASYSTKMSEPGW